MHITAHVKYRLEELHLERYSEPMEFVDHHSSPPTHYPCVDVADKPDLLGVFLVSKNFSWNDTPRGGCKTNIPYYRIERVVELKDFGKEKAVSAV